MSGWYAFLHFKPTDDAYLWLFRMWVAAMWPVSHCGLTLLMMPYPWLFSLWVATMPCCVSSLIWFFSWWVAAMTMTHHILSLLMMPVWLFRRCVAGCLACVLLHPSLISTDHDHPSYIRMCVHTLLLSMLTVFIFGSSVCKCSLQAHWSKISLFIRQCRLWHCPLFKMWYLHIATFHLCDL